MCVSLMSVLIVLKLCIFFFFALCFSVFVYLFTVMSCLLTFFIVYFVYDSYTNNSNAVLCF